MHDWTATWADGHGRHHVLIVDLGTFRLRVDGRTLITREYGDPLRALDRALGMLSMLPTTHRATLRMGYRLRKRARLLADRPWMPGQPVTGHLL